MSSATILSAFAVVVLCGITAQAAVLHHPDRFTFLGSRSQYDNLKKEFIESNYYASAASGIWTQSADDCLKTFGLDGALVSIETEQEQEDINLWLQERGSGGAIFWTSGLYEIEEGIWRWSGNAGYEFPTYTNWFNGTAPVSPNGRQRIGLNHQNRFSASWMSFDDTNLERYICELKSAENIGTGATAAQTTAAPTTTAAATSAKPCNSTLKQVPGFTYLGKRPSYSQQTKEFIESNYYASAASGIWTQSADDCLKTFGLDGALVSIETEQEQDDINLWLQERGSGGAIFWTSGLYEIEEGIWRWSGNAGYEFPTYTNWANGTAPVSPNGRQRIGLNHQNRFSASWMSFDDTNLERYICELRSADNVC